MIVVKNCPAIINCQGKLRCRNGGKLCYNIDNCVIKQIINNKNKIMEILNIKEIKDEQL